MNRETRRHPTHPYLPLLYPSNKRVPDEGRKGTCVNSKKISYKPRRRKKS